MAAVRIASPGVVDEVARFLEATAPAVDRAARLGTASRSAADGTLQPLLSFNPFAPVQHPRVCPTTYGLGADKAPSIDAATVLAGVADDARRAELQHVYRCVCCCSYMHVY